MLTPEKKRILWAAAGTLGAGALALFNLSPAREHPAVNQTLPKVDEKRLEAHVRALAEEFTPRDWKNRANLTRAAEYIYNELKSYGLAPRYQTFRASGQEYKNVTVELGPASEARVVIGAHYDAFGPYPGADDNASGVAGVLELARILAKSSLPGRIELVAYCLEEPPHFTTAEMGSAVHARSLREAGVKVKGMISLEMIGYFSDEKNSQAFPLPALKLLYPNEGNFIALAADMEHVPFTNRVKKAMRAATPLGVHAINAPRSVPGIDLSDHRNYWAEGYPALMVTDTAFYRNEAYHTPNDTPDRLDYARMGQVVSGVARAALELSAE
jgi:Zn-dependent M28 family amino/carboxypeptidase